MSFQSGAVFCSSHLIRGFPCHKTINWTPELEFNVYHNMKHRRPRRASSGRTKVTRMRVNTRAFMAFVFWPNGGDCTLGSLVVRQFCTL